jgi:hypothetical protein
MGATERAPEIVFAAPPQLVTNGFQDEPTAVWFDPIDVLDDIRGKGDGNALGVGHDRLSMIILIRILSIARSIASRMLRVAT